MKHILIIPNYFPNKFGKQNGVFIQDQAEAIANFGLKVGVVHPVFIGMRKFSLKNFRRYHFQKQTTFEHGYSVIRKYNWRIPYLKEFQKKLWIRATIKLVKKYIKTFGKPDIIHSHFILNAGVVAQQIKEKFGIPYVVTCHWGAFSEYFKQLIGEDGIEENQIPLIEKVLDNANYVFCVSKSIMSNIIKFTENRNFALIPNMVHRDFFKNYQNMRKSNFFARSKIEIDPFIFIVIGSLRPVKNHKLIISAFSNLLATKDEHFRLKIVGDGILRKEIENMLKDRPFAEKRIEILGQLTRRELIVEINKSHAVLLTSFWESFGLSVPEGIAMGIPAIATRCGGSEETMSKVDVGYLINHDLHELRDAMHTIRSEYEKFDPRVLRYYIKKSFGEDTICRLLNNFYDEVLK